MTGWHVCAYGLQVSRMVKRVRRVMSRRALCNRHDADAARHAARAHDATATAGLASAGASEADRELFSALARWLCELVRSWVKNLEALGEGGARARNACRRGDASHVRPPHTGPPSHAREPETRPSPEEGGLVSCEAGPLEDDGSDGWAPDDGAHVLRSLDEWQGFFDPVFPCLLDWAGL